MSRTLIACVGNIFLGDDGFGVEVAQRLLRREQKYPQGIDVIDFGIRGIELAYSLLEGYETLVLVDTVSRGEPPGTVFLIEPDLSATSSDDSFALDAHSLDPVKVFAFARTLGVPPIHTLLVGCEPASIDEMQMGLSEPVQTAVGEAIKMIDALVADLCMPTT
ncbi:peptidase M52 [Reticulibacter mediterranei]|uniref:Peptidase M52 n=1 Tax=Reticulibacter mediterranei TaxID=2778369 RepID=A0A8J3IRT5_9CHLR|nr:hydrogenase maturation protease [Reticulibacter mediterranei]GHO97340.1 peptidase M52 [Reticulibacter mediterranei]